MSETRRRLRFLLALLAAFLVTGLVVLPLPFTRDQGIYSYVAWRWLGDAMPYRDAFDHKGPLLYLIYALALKLSGGAMWGPNLFDLLARSLTIALVYAAGKELFSSRAGLYSAFLAALPLFGIFNSCWWNAQAETFIMPLLIGSVWLAVRKGERWRRLGLAGAGFLAGSAVMLKLNVLPHALWLLAWAVSNPGPSNPSRGKIVLSFCAGLIGSMGLWLIYYWFKGALSSLWEVYVIFNSIHAAADFSRPTLLRMVRGLWTIWWLVPVLLLFLFIPAGRKELGNRPLIFSWIWLAVGVFEVLVQTKLFLYHWLLIVPAMGLLTGAGLESLHRSFRGPRFARLGPPIVALLLVWLTLGFGRSWFLIEESYQTRDYLAGRISLHDYYARFNSGDAKGRGDFSLLASVAAADYARNHVPAGGTVLVFGYEPIVNYLAARPAPDRFEIDYPITFTPHTDAAAQLREKWRAQFMADLRRAPPHLVILVDHDQNSIEAKPSFQQAYDFTEFWTWLNQNYMVYDRIEDFYFYVRKWKSI